jgi:hypothetical protein
VYDIKSFLVHMLHEWRRVRRDGVITFAQGIEQIFGILRLSTYKKAAEAVHDITKISCNWNRTSHDLMSS